MQLKLLCFFTEWNLVFIGQGYREPVVRTHDQMSYIGPERAYAGPAVNLPVPVNMFIPPAMPPTFNGQAPMHMGK